MEVNGKFGFLTKMERLMDSTKDEDIDPAIDPVIDPAIDPAIDLFIQTYVDIAAQGNIVGGPSSLTSHQELVRVARDIRRHVRESGLLREKFFETESHEDVPLLPYGTRVIE